MLDRVTHLEAETGSQLRAPLGFRLGALNFVAGLEEVPDSNNDSTASDGAGPSQRFRHLILPPLSLDVLFILVIQVIGSLHALSQAFVVARVTREPVESTRTDFVLVSHIALKYVSMRYASALAVLLFLAILVVSLIIFRVSGRRDHDEGGTRSGSSTFAQFGAVEVGCGGLLTRGRGEREGIAKSRRVDHE